MFETEGKEKFTRQPLLPLCIHGTAHTPRKCHAYVVFRSLLQLPADVLHLCLDQEAKVVSGPSLSSIEQHISRRLANFVDYLQCCPWLTAFQKPSALSVVASLQLFMDIKLSCLLKRKPHTCGGLLMSVQALTCPSAPACCV